MANVQFFHSVLFCLIAMTLVSGGITGALALRTHADGWHVTGSQFPAGSGEMARLSRRLTHTFLSRGGSVLLHDACPDNGFLIQKPGTTGRDLSCLQERRDAVVDGGYPCLFVIR